MHARQVAVEHDYVVVGVGGMGEGVLAVEGHVDGHAFPAQPSRHGGGELGVVLDQQHPHRPLPLGVSLSLVPVAAGTPLSWDFVCPRMPGWRLHGGNSVTAVLPRPS